jgi:rubrerythrin
MSEEMTMDIEQADIERAFEENRRLFLKRAGILAVGAGAAGLFTGSATDAAAPRAASDVGVIQTALALEHEGIAAYRIAGKSGLLSPPTLKVALIFMGHHEAHRESLAKLVREGGAKPVEPKSDADYIKGLNLESLKSEKDVVTLATSLEHGAASAYIMQITAIKNPKIASLFASISADEATHWATLNNAAGMPIPKAAYIFA